MECQIGGKGVDEEVKKEDTWYIWQLESFPCNSHLWEFPKLAVQTAELSVPEEKKDPCQEEENCEYTIPALSPLTENRRKFSLKNR